MLDKVTDLLLFFGKLLVVGGVGKDDDRALGKCTTLLISFEMQMLFIIEHFKAAQRLF